MRFERCKACGDFDWIREHKCFPEWEVWPCDSDRRYSEIIYAANEKCAAEKYARAIDDNGDYPFMRGREEKVFVVSYEATVETKPKKFIVSGESIPHYSAKEIE